MGLCLTAGRDRGQQKDFDHLNSNIIANNGPASVDVANEGTSGALLGAPAQPDGQQNGAGKNHKHDSGGAQGGNKEIQKQQQAMKKRFRKVATKLSKKVVNIKFKLWSQVLGPYLQTLFIVATALSTGASFGYLLDAVDPKSALQQPPALVPGDLPPGFPYPEVEMGPTATPLPPPPPTEPATTMPPSPAAPASPLQSGLWAFSGHREKHDELVEGVAVSADGNRVATAGRDQMATIMLDSRKAGSREIIELSNDNLLAVALNHDGSIMAVGGEKGEQDAVVYLLSEDTDPPFEQAKELQGHTGWVKSVSLSADGSVLASGSETGELMLWDTTASESTQMLQSNLSAAHGGHAVLSVALSADGTRMVSGGADSVVRLWNIHNFTFVLAHEYKDTEQHGVIVHAVAISADGTRVASGSADGDARLWDFDTGDLVGVFADAGQRNADNEDVILGVSLNSDGSLLATGSKNGVIRLWNTVDDSIPALHTIDQYINGTNGNVANLTYVAAVSLNANGTLLAAACKPAVVYFWDVTGVVELLSSPLASTMRQHHNHRKLLL